MWYNTSCSQFIFVIFRPCHRFYVVIVEQIVLTFNGVIYKLAYKIWTTSQPQRCREQAPEKYLRKTNSLETLHATFNMNNALQFQVEI